VLADLAERIAVAHADEVEADRLEDVKNIGRA